MPRNTTCDPVCNIGESAEFLKVTLNYADNDKKLAKLMLRYNIRFREEQVLRLEKIDEEFFEN
jgi:restriction endonuclease Mrr